MPLHLTPFVRGRYSTATLVMLCWLFLAGFTCIGPPPTPGSTDSLFVPRAPPTPGSTDSLFVPRAPPTPGSTDSLFVPRAPPTPGSTDSLFVPRAPPTPGSTDSLFVPRAPPTPGSREIDTYLALTLCSFPGPTPRQEAEKLTPI
ncbi:extensin-like [Coregonus clupeaformis]|uniref:extensin-like n=1 Tax=Coregonus clupeaformis TaxID=59861 RepID=UPI001E1C67AF|nr:extensin-like [Coregonus clupeaformis]